MRVVRGHPEAQRDLRADHGKGDTTASREFRARDSGRDRESVIHGKPRGPSETSTISHPVCQGEEPRKLPHATLCFARKGLPRVAADNDGFANPNGDSAKAKRAF